MSRPHRLARAALLLLLPLAGSACGRSPDEGAEAAWVEARLADLDPRSRAAQLVAARPADTAGLRPPGPGALWVDTAAAAPAAGPAPLAPLVAADVDHGLGGMVADAPELPPPGALGAAGDPGLAREAGAAVAAEARAAGIGMGVVAGPPLGRDASLGAADLRTAEAAEGIAAYLEGLADGGLLPALVPFPAPAAPEPPPGLRWDRAALEAVHLPLLRRAVEEGVEALVLEPVVLPALSGDTVALPLSPAVVTGLIRRDLGFGGLVVADLRGVEAPVPADAAVRAVRAGADLVLTDRPAEAEAAILRAAREGRLPPARTEAAVRRGLRARARLRADSVPGVDRGVLAALSDGERSLAGVAEEANARALVVRPAAAPPLTGCVAPLLAVRPDAAAPVLERALAGRFPGMPRVETDSVALSGPPVRGAPPAADSADCVILLRVGGSGPVPTDSLPGATVAGDTAAADTTSADTASADGDASPADTAAAVDSVAPPPRRLVEVGLATRPRAAAPLPDAGVYAWGTGPGAQAAAARALAERTAPSRDGDALAGAAWPPAPRLRDLRPEAVGMSADSLRALDRVLEAAVDSGFFTGAAVAVGRRGGLVRLAGYGRVGLDSTAAEVRGRTTLFDLASLTKVVGTTAAVMALVDDGRIRLDAPVRRYLPEFRGDGREDVTVRHLLTHTAGLPPGDWLFGSADDPEQALRQALRAPVVRTPGERMVYSDFGMILMAEAARRRAEEPLDRFLARRVFLPLGMSSTGYRPPLPLREEAAATLGPAERPYVLRGVVHDANAFRLGGVAGHAGLFSTARDVAVLAQTLLNGGAYGPRRIFSEETVRAFTTSQDVPGERGLGWDVPADRSSAGEFFSARSFGHTGYTGTSLWIDPERDLFVVLLTNRTRTGAGGREMLRVRQRVHDAAARAIVDEEVLPRPGAVESG